MYRSVKVVAGIASLTSCSAMILRTRQKAALLESDNMTAWGSDGFSSLASTNSSKPHLVLGIGFPKCGSHHTWEVFSQHGATVTGYEKELKYFAWPDASPNTFCHALFEEGINAWELTPAQRYVKACYGAAGETDGKTLLEFSPGYASLRDDRLEQTFERLGDVWDQMTIRMIALVREPVQRAASEINMFRAYGTTNGTDEELSEILRQQLSFFNGNPRGYHIIAGEYVDSINMWLKHFPKESLLVVNTATLDDVAVWRRMFLHAGLEVPSDDWIRSTITAAAGNDRKEQSTYLQLSGDAERDLKAHYADYNQKLWELLGVQPWW